MHEPATATARPGFDRRIGAVIPFYLPRTVGWISNSLNRFTPM
jgi:hypothetical protein